MNARELIAELGRIDPDTPILISGYEGGFTTPHLTSFEVQRLDRDGDQDYLGEYERVDEARRQAGLDPSDPELDLASLSPPRLVGSPVMAAVLTRVTR
ncbi:hypothetical protein ACT17_28315 [Mycolicibacterium conceptionense]|uniref:Uncharacterized protein n=1 Tax=Mycolicibacterium conceptionense TaxID=451644 RepID=A0A0J8U330_9MYCO|nr:hypothetical protein [Mycolicibacterium conceptionense]KMV14840.1 hypothetical protein ACT17_28315 [Mycolicibacterium conceptionense]